MHSQDPAAPPTIFDRFGGIRPMAAALGEKPSMVMGWKRKGVIPRWWAGRIIEVACIQGIILSDDDLAMLGRERPEGEIGTVEAGQNVGHNTSPVNPPGERVKNTQNAQIVDSDVAQERAA
jgi:hypothetical protein